jgi:hypothetical protein
MGSVETAPLWIPIKLSICELDNHLQVVLETSRLATLATTKAPSTP